MAFNFNWSPLTADAEFYTRAQELLTTALNKSPKPPIIVDDILVNELNLGTTPPDLEILEIGDLAEDRFRGIFKMCYNGDAFVTLKTRVQANPLNTYLSTRPAFTSPQPVAAASGLTIPIQITLSEFKLSAFIILVFSKQKGITLVFRNDPLESMRVSSTFDGIPFVRDYLQRVIESQLRALLMDELPLIIHRLSLRLFVPEYKEKEDRELARKGAASTVEEKPVDPLASPPQDPVDAAGNPLDQNDIASLSLDSTSEMHALFSQKNILRLSALTDSHKTLSLFTPSIRDAVFRAWTGPTERGESSSSGKVTPASAPTLTRAHTFNGSNSTTYTFAKNAERPPLASRQSLSTLSSTAANLGLGSKSSKPKGRKRKHRVVNLRKKVSTADGEELESISGDSNTNSETLSSTQSDPLAQPRTPGRNVGELVTPPSSPEQVMKEPGDADVGLTPPRYRDATRDITPRARLEAPRPEDDFDRTPRQSQYLSKDHKRPSLRASQSFQHPQHPISTAQQPAAQTPSQPALSQSPGLVDPPRRTLSPSPFVKGPSPSTSSAAAQPTDSTTNNEAQTAWMTKMASMIAQKVQDQKAADSGFWDRPASMQQHQQHQQNAEEEPPPAYST